MTKASENPTTLVFSAESRLSTRSAYRQISAPAAITARTANVQRIVVRLRASTGIRSIGRISPDAVPGTFVGRRQVRFGKPQRGGTG